jgi:hypothetical protein
MLTAYHLYFTSQALYVSPGLNIEGEPMWTPLYIQQWYYTKLYKFMFDDAIDLTIESSQQTHTK